MFQAWSSDTFDPGLWVADVTLDGRSEEDPRFSIIREAARSRAHMPTVSILLVQVKALINGDED